MKITQNHPKHLVLAKAWILLLFLFSGLSANSQVAPGSALNLNGISGDATITMTQPPTNNYTISAWVYLRSGGAFANPRVAIVSGSCGTTSEFLIRGNTASDPQYMELGRCSNYEGVVSIGAVPLNQWVQVSVQVTYNNSLGSNVVAFFTNGASAGVGYLPGPNNVSLGTNLILGYNNNSDRKFDGYLDEVQIWNGAAPPVTNNVLNGAEANLLAYYRFDEGSGTTSGNIAFATNASSATLQGVAAWLHIPASPFPAGTPAPGVDWVAQGPAYIRDNDNGGIVSGAWGVTPDYPDDGMVMATAPHPTDPNIVYAAAPNGGIWKTVNATAPFPSWIPLTDQEPSPSMACIEFDPTDATHQTLVAGFGNFSSSGQGAPRLGMLRTTDGGTTWQQIFETNIVGAQIHSVAARGNTLLAASRDVQAGLYRSTNAGASFTNLAGAPSSGLPADNVDWLASVPGNVSRFYAALRTKGIYRSDDTGATWTSVSSGLTNIPHGFGLTTVRSLVSVHNAATDEVVYAAVANTDTNTYIFFSTNAGANWTQFGKGPRSGGLFTFAADPTNASLAYIRGDGFTLTRIDRSQTNLTSLEVYANTNGRSVHVDTHSIKFDASGSLIETDDGGIYLLPRLAATSGTNGVTPDSLDGWRCLSGNLQLTEFWSISYDPLRKLLFGGTQDNGRVEQRTSGNKLWDTQGGGDIFKVAVDARSISSESVRWLTYSYITPGWVDRCIYSNTLVTNSSPALSVLTGETFVPHSFAMEINAVDPRRLIVCDFNTVFESTDGLQTLRNALLPRTTRFYHDPYLCPRMVYGGYLNGVPNPDVIWAVGENIGAGNYSIALRTNAATPAQFLGPFTTELKGIVANSANWQQAYYLTANNIFQTVNAGQTWSDITANLAGGSVLRTLEFLPLPSGDALAVGTDDGVYITRLGISPLWWTRLGSSLPRAICFSLHYDPSDQILALGTLGRGAWTYSLAGWPQLGGPGMALNFNAGGTNYLNAQFVPQSGLASNYTISAWLNLRTGGELTNPRTAIFSSFGCGGNAEFLLRSTTANVTDPQYLELARCGNFDGTLSTVPVPLNQWVYVAVTVGPTLGFGGSVSNLVSYYINGNPAGSSYYINRNLSIGPGAALGLNNGSTRKFDGLLDQVSVWSEALPPDAIPESMVGAQVASPLVMSFNFDEGTGVQIQGYPGKVSIVGSADWAPSAAPYQSVSPVMTQPATGISAYSATLAGICTPLGEQTSSFFQYGLTTSYTDSTNAETISINSTNALVLNGVSDFVATTIPVAQPGPQVFTISLWFKTTSKQGGRLLGFGSKQTVASPVLDRHLYLGTDGLLRFGVYDTTFNVISGGGACNDGAWHHAAGTFSQADGMRLYLDGVQVASKSNVGPAFSYTGGGYWRIGWDEMSNWEGASPNSHFAGAISEIQVWDTVLSPAAIADNYNSPLTGTEPGLNTYLKLNEGSGTVAMDSAPADGSNNGLLLGSPVWLNSLERAIPFSFTATVSGLEPGTTYHFRAGANNGVGASFGADQTFMTGPPSLSVAPSGTAGVLISWPFPATGFILEQKQDLSQPGPWTPVSAPGITNNGLIMFSVLFSTNTANFFRLHKP